MARYGPLLIFFQKRSNLFGHLGHLGHFLTCRAFHQMTVEVTCNLEVIPKVIFLMADDQMTYFQSIEVIWNSNHTGYFDCQGH